MKYITIGELRMDDKVVPMSSSVLEDGKIFTVTNLHPDQSGLIVAVGLLDPIMWREHTSRTTVYALLERVWGN